jgi:hypothetical protein
VRAALIIVGLLCTPTRGAARRDALPARLLPAPVSRPADAARDAVPGPVATFGIRGPTFDIRQFGATPNDENDDTPALTEALDAARALGGGVVQIPAGTYIVRPLGELSGIRIGSNIWIRGEGPESVLRVQSNVGSYDALFSSYPAPNSHVENVRFSDLRVDQNCRVSGGDVRHSAEGHRFAVLLLYDASNITVERTVFDPVCGVNTIDINGARVRNVVVAHSRFRFVRGPSTLARGDYDNSAVYLHGTKLEATNNIFESTFADGARGAIELHGAEGTASSNVTRQYRSCVRVAGASSSAEPKRISNDFSVSDNSCFEANDAINAWALTGHSLRGVRIIRNLVTIASRQHALSAHRGISLTWDSVSGTLNGDYADILIEDNVISFQPERERRYDGYETSGGIVLQAEGSLDTATVRGNVVRGAPTQGMRIHSRGSRSRSSHVRIEENVITGFVATEVAGSHRVGIVAAGVLDDVTITNNVISSGGPASNRPRPIVITPSAGSRKVDVVRNTVTSD